MQEKIIEKILKIRIHNNINLKLFKSRPINRTAFLYMQFSRSLVDIITIIFKLKVFYLELLFSVNVPFKF